MTPYLPLHYLFVHLFLRNRKVCTETLLYASFLAFSDKDELRNGTQLPSKTMAKLFIYGTVPQSPLPLVHHLSFLAVHGGLDKLNTSLLEFGPPDHF